MGNISLHTEASGARRFDAAEECARLEAELAERTAELSALQERFREFKLLYARVVGGRLAELAEVEGEVRAAEARLLGLEEEEAAEADGEEPHDFYAQGQATAGRASLKKLFWSVARLFHPDHAADEGEAGRRHTIMAEASRAYRDGDVDSLSTLLGDEQLQFYCASASRDEEAEDAGTRLLNLKEELRTAEFGLKRIRQDRLYHLMLSAEEEAAAGRDALAEMAERINRKIRKARNRLEHLS
ncbi:MAG TPA: hypothetical protein VEY09_14700 [Pyrinomonadaceae bacterium]|nr:hypothetical protein [Pyrinomonadaceae bacterium]